MGAFLGNEGAQSLGRGVDRRRQTARAGPDDHDVVERQGGFRLQPDEVG